MSTVNIHEAKTNLSRLIERALAGEAVVIARAGKPLVRMVPIEADAPAPKRRIGFLKGRITVPDDIKTPYRDEMEGLFYGTDR
jgi:prevent-host-death family protein